MATLRPEIAIIGAGLMGRWHAETACRLGARVVAIVDPDPTRAGALAHRYRAMAIASLADLPAPSAKGVAHVCTPVATHASACEALLTTGWHVLCEKPLAGSADEVRRLLQIADGNGRRLCAVHQFASQRGVSRVRTSLGKRPSISHVAFCICTAGGVGLAADERDGLVCEVLPHPLAVLRAWLPEAILADANWHVDHANPGEVQATGLVAGVPVSLLITCSSRPTEARAVVRGPDGTAYVDFFHGYASFSSPAVSRSRKILRPLTDPIAHFLSAASNLARRAVTRELAYPGLRDLTRRFYLAVSNDGPPPMSSADLVDIYCARDSIELALRAPQ